MPTTPPEIEEMIEEFKDLYVKIEEVMDVSVLEKYEQWLRTTLTTLHQKHQEEVKKAVETERERFAQILWSAMNCATSNKEHIEIMSILKNICRNTHLYYWQKAVEDERGVQRTALYDLQALTPTKSDKQ